MRAGASIGGAAPPAPEARQRQRAATVIVAFSACATCSIVVGRENEATEWNSTKVIVTAVAAVSKRMRSGVGVMAVLRVSIGAMRWGEGDCPAEGAWQSLSVLKRR